MNRIFLLPEDVSSKIAAGEVIERPASVVRELIDNSIDAFSKSIIIKTENCGLEKITVSDNGSGIEREDLSIALKKHTTSKIKNINDLLNLSTMGFRGEALHSIQTVSNFSITSNIDDSGVLPGYKISNYGEKSFETIPVASKQGTKVEVSNLFYNIPARLKFLKSHITELNQIKKIITDKALSYTDVSFEYFNDDKIVFETTGNGIFKDAFFSLNKNEEVFDIFDYFNIINSELQITIFYSSPDYFFSSRKYQMLYVNKRPVSVNFFYSALDNGSRDYISPGRYPLFYVFIDINPSLIDVNIHPAKKEIKFYDQNDIYLAIQNSISKALSSVVKREIVENNISLANSSSNQDMLFENLKQEGKSSSDTVYEKNILYIDKIERKEKIEESESFYSDKESIRIHGICFDNYIIVENNEKLLLIDQHAASESIIFQMKREKFLKKRDIEKMLIPVIIEIDKWNDSTERKIDLLNNTGFLIEKYEGNTIIVKEIPSILLIKKDYQIVIDIICKFIEDEYCNTGDVLDYVLIEASCKEAVKKGDKLNLIEIDEIVKEYFKRNISNCPHGRPSHFEISKANLEKLFQRKK